MAGVAAEGVRAHRVHGRKKDREVTTYVVGVEIGKRSLIAWLGGATLVGLPLGGAMSWILATVGLYQQLYLSLIPVVLAGSASVWLFVGRERRGLRLLRYQGLVDRRRAARSRGRLFVGTKAVQPATVNILIPVVIDTPIAMLRALDDAGLQPTRPSISTASRAGPPRTQRPCHRPGTTPPSLRPPPRCPTAGPPTAERNAP